VDLESGPRLLVYIYIYIYIIITMGMQISTIAHTILPSVMSFTGTVVKGTGTIHGGLTSFIARTAVKGVLTAICAII